MRTALFFAFALPFFFSFSEVVGQLWEMVEVINAENVGGGRKGACFGKDGPLVIFGFLLQCGRRWDEVGRRKKEQERDGKTRWVQSHSPPWFMRNALEKGLSFSSGDGDNGIGNGK